MCVFLENGESLSLSLWWCIIIIWGGWIKRERESLSPPHVVFVFSHSVCVCVEEGGESFLWGETPSLSLHHHHSQQRERAASPRSTTPHTYVHMLSAPFTTYICVYIEREVVVGGFRERTLSLSHIAKKNLRFFLNLIFSPDRFLHFLGIIETTCFPVAFGIYYIFWVIYRAL